LGAFGFLVHKDLLVRMVLVVAAAVAAAAVVVNTVLSV
jgi:hypothetical protein